MPNLLPTECPDCGGDAAADDKGRVYCTACAQAADWGRFFEELRHERLERAGLLEEPLLSYTFEAFTTPTGIQRRAKAMVLGWLDNWPYDKGESVLLWSEGYGVGKTHLTHAAERVLLERGVTVTFYMVADLLASVRDSYNDSEALTENALLSRARRAQVLILDDLGKAHVTARGQSWAHELMFRIVDHRYRSGRSMLLTSNVSPDKLGELVGGAAASRLYRMLGGRIVDMSGPDWRMK